jgi:hypothetical protein
MTITKDETKTKKSSSPPRCRRRHYTRGSVFLLVLVCSTRSMHTLDTQLFNRLIINRYGVYLFVRLFNLI